MLRCEKKNSAAGVPHGQMIAAVACVVGYQYRGPPRNDPRVHNLGNVGVGGAVHALVAPAITRAIDALAYGGVDVRVVVRRADSVDLGCGTGFSTAADGVGVDASRAMLAVARVLHPEKAFVRGLAETWGRDDSCACACLSFVLHEQPRSRRVRMLRNAMRICRDEVRVLDICPTYAPSELMRGGEPYLDDYLCHIDDEIHAAYDDVEIVDVVRGHARLWIGRKSAAARARRTKE